MTGPSWKHRRRLIYSSFGLSVFMILFAASIYRTDTQVASQLIVGGVSLISIILTAYTAFATLDDRWHFKQSTTEIISGIKENTDTIGPLRLEEYKDEDNESGNLYHSPE